MKFVIEIDGGQRYLEKGAEEDKTRDRHLVDLGLTVMRFSNREVFENIEGILQRIRRHLENPTRPAAESPTNPLQCIPLRAAFPSPTRPGAFEPLPGFLA